MESILPHTVSFAVGCDVLKEDLDSIFTNIHACDQIESICIFVYYNFINTEHIGSLMDAIFSKPSLTTLHISSSYLASAGGLRLAKSLRFNFNLRSISLNGTMVGDIPATSIIAALENNQNLTFLDLSGNGIQNKAVIYLADNVLNRSNLEHVVLALNTIEDEGVTALAKALASNTKLTTLDLKRNDFGLGESVYDLAEALKTNTTLTYLDLSSNKISVPCANNLFKVLDTNSSLRVLKVPSRYHPQFKERIDFFEFNNTLSYLHIRFFQLKDSDTVKIGKILARNTVLEKLDLSCNKLKNLTCISENLASMSSLVNLNLSNNMITPDAIQHLSLALKDNHVLEELNLSFNKIRSEGLEYISDVLYVNTVLKVLSISANKIDDRGVAHLARALTTNSSLTHLDICHNKIRSCTKLLQSLITNKSLTYLSFSNNKVGDPALIELIPVLTQNTNLNTIIATNCRFTEYTFSSFVVSLRWNWSLIHMDFHESFMMGSRDIFQLKNFVSRNAHNKDKKNDTLQSLLLGYFYAGRIMGTRHTCVVPR